jgi:hypothetical protein
MDLFGAVLNLYGPRSFAFCKKKNSRQIFLLYFEENFGGKKITL